MNINDAFPSKYLKASDIPPRTRICAHIDRVVMEDLGSERKPVVYFLGKEKGLVLNKTNALTIQGLHGDDTDDWHGKVIRMYATTVVFEGSKKPCIRVSDEPMDNPPPPPAPPPLENGGDDIPF